MDEKERYISNLRDLMTQFANLHINAVAVHTAGQQRGYDQWTDQDLAGITLFNGQPMTNNDLLSMIYRLDEFKAFMTGGQVAAINRAPIVDKYRGDL